MVPAARQECRCVHDYGGAEEALTAARLSSYLSFTMLSGTRARVGP
jgi:hypothetical protein